MQKDGIREVWDHYKNGKATKEELALLESWYLNFEDIERSALSEAEISERLDAVGRNLPLAGKAIRLWQIVGVAAAVIVSILFAVWFNTGNFEGMKHGKDDVAYNDIRPGKNTATLTLANGKKIILSDALTGKLAEEAGVSISKAGNGQLIYEIKELPGNSGGVEAAKVNTLSTARGETYEVVLPDKTHVWLNAASSITYPSSFAALKERKVQLTGEAYFEVSKNKRQPFVVATEDQEVTVVGTHFNLNNYADEDATRTTLLEGSVQVGLRKGVDRSSVMLKPGQQSRVEGEKLEVTEADLDGVMGWKNGYFRFNDENIESIMRKLSRWYDIDVRYDGRIPTEGYSGKISRYKNISQVLKMLDYSQTMHFKIEGRRVTIMQ